MKKLKEIAAVILLSVLGLAATHAFMQIPEGERDTLFLMMAGSE